MNKYYPPLVPENSYHIYNHAVGWINTFIEKEIFQYNIIKQLFMLLTHILFFRTFAKVFIIKPLLSSRFFINRFKYLLNIS